MHQAIESLTAAIDLATSATPDPDHMLLPIECVAIDDAVWWHMHRFDTGESAWISTAPAAAGRWTATMQAEPPADIDRWRVAARGK